MQTQKRNFVNRRMLGLIIGMMGLVSANNGLFVSIVRAQDQCVNALAEAQKLYELGRYTQIIELLNPWLPDNLREIERVRAYRLLALAYLAEEYPEKAETAIKNLLKQDENYLPDPVQDSQQFIELVEKVRKRLLRPIIKMIKINFAYPISFPNNDSFEPYGPGFISGIEILFGRKFFSGFSFEYTKYFTSPQILTSELDPTPLGEFRNNISGQFYSVVLMYEPHRLSRHRKLLAFGTFKAGMKKQTFNSGVDYINSVKDVNRFAFSIQAGIAVSVKSVFHPFISANYSFTNLRREFGDSSNLFVSVKTCLAGSLGVIIRL
jgi:tetratricopeptide (TPR) repeat protein